MCGIDEIVVKALICVFERINVRSLVKLRASLNILYPKFSPYRNKQSSSARTERRVLSSLFTLHLCRHLHRRYWPGGRLGHRHFPPAAARRSPFALRPAAPSIVRHLPGTVRSAPRTPPQSCY